MSKTQNKLYRRLGEKIKQYRLIRGLSQRQIAKKLKVTWETVSRWENGRVSPIKRLQDIANILDIPATYLLQDQFFDKNNQQVKHDSSTGIPYIGDMPNNPKELINKLKKTLFVINLKAIAPSHSYALKINTDHIKNLTNIPINNNTIILITPDLQAKANYFIYFDSIKKQFILANNQLKGKTYEMIANILAIILQ